MNPDEQHLREYNKYLEQLVLQKVLNLTPDEEAIRQFRVESVKNCIEIIKNKQK